MFSNFFPYTRGKKVRTHTHVPGQYLIYKIEAVLIKIPRKISVSIQGELSMNNRKKNKTSRTKQQKPGPVVSVYIRVGRLNACKSIISELSPSVV